MGRGIVSGLIWGAVTSLVILSVASLLAGQPAGNTPPEAPQVAAPEAAAVAEPDAAPVTEAAAPTQDDMPSSVPEVAAPQAGTAAALSDTAPGDAPVATGIEGSLATPEAGTTPELAAGSEAPVLPNPQAAAPVVPGADGTASISAEPTQPPTPESSTAEAMPDATEEIVVVEEPAGPDVPGEAAQPVASAGETGSVDAASAERIARGADDGAATGGAQTSEATGEVEEAAPVADAASGETGPPQPAIVTSETDRTPATEDAGTRLALAGETAGLPSAGNGVVIRRPGADASEEAATAPAESGDVLTVEELPADAPALLRYAEPFENEAGLPMMAIVVVDDGSLDGAVTALGGLPFPISVGVDPAAPDAAEAAAGYRAAGFEVLAVPSLPQGAAPADVEVTLGAAFEAVPEAVALLDAGAAGLQGPGGVTDQAMAALAADGRGFVTVSRGLNAALRAAEAAEVPSAVIYRDLDGEGEDARVIRRFLDQAAFRARQEGGVVMLARARPDTISALILWGTANRRGQVALVPVSAILRGD